MLAPAFGQVLPAANGVPHGRVSRLTINTGSITVLHLRAGFVSSVRLPEEISSVVLGDPKAFSFGRVVLLEDPYLKTGISQWIAHFNLCGPIRGADVWYQTFFCGLAPLGMNFDRDQLEAYLSSVYGSERTGVVGPMIGMYEDDAAFHTCGALSEASGRVVRKSAPVNDELGFAYGAWVLEQICDHFPGAGQVSVTDLDRKAGWRTIPGWDIGNHQRVLELVERKGVLEVDRHMEPWLLRPCATALSVWRRIYDDLL
jgi:hypothetical protein